MPKKVEAFWTGGLAGGASSVQEELQAWAAEAEQSNAHGSSHTRASNSQEDEALALVMADVAGAVRCLHAARMAESAATIVCGSADNGGRFLNALAARTDLDGKSPFSGAATSFAAKLRQEMTAAVGNAAASQALLRQMTRDGRLSPGMAPTVAGPVVLSENGDLTPEADVKRLFGLCQ